jgi:hypothetical protein
MADSMLSSIKTVGKTVTDDSIRALDLRSREAIEALTTDAAKEIANFLYDRDRDIRRPRTRSSEGGIPPLPGRPAAERFTSMAPGNWPRMANPGFRKHRSPAKPKSPARSCPTTPRTFHARPPEYQGEAEQRPLFVEMTYVDLNGNEKIKVTTGNVTEKSLKNVADRSNTFVKAETYFAELKKLKPGEIYVSDVIGAYVPTEAHRPLPAGHAGKGRQAVHARKSAYAGTENPVGKRFRGIVRWAMPVVKGGKITGYVTLALDHDHIRQFSDRLMPTEERYTPIADAIKGNYAFHLGLQEPRHFASARLLHRGLRPSDRPAGHPLDG